MFASFICPPMVFLAILGLSSIGDLTASQIGIRFGKKRIKWNTNKTWEGTISSALICFILSFFFVGFVWALLFAILILIVDLLTPKLVKISDKAERVHAFTFDNFNLFPRRVSFKTLKSKKMISGANLVTAEKVSSKNLAKICEFGFCSRDENNE